MNIDTSELKAPEGFVIDRIGTITPEDTHFLGGDTGEPSPVLECFHGQKGYVILRKQFTPELGEVIEVSTGDSVQFFRVFTGFRKEDGRYMCLNGLGDDSSADPVREADHGWDTARPAVPTEVVKATQFTPEPGDVIEVDTGADTWEARIFVRMDGKEYRCVNFFEDHIPDTFPGSDTHWYVARPAVPTEVVKAKIVAPKGYTFVTNEEREKYEIPAGIEMKCFKEGYGWGSLGLHHTWKPGSGFTVAVPLDYVFEEKKAKFKVFLISWLEDGPEILGDELTTDYPTVQGYRIFGYTDDVEWAEKVTDNSFGHVPFYAQVPCAHNADMSYAIGRYVG